ncbi:MAG: hypothetical protein JSS02_16810 [Planctomycetes bacterium]|nr:hypothetical protein [Planctomycetota bacterium]
MWLDLIFAGGGTTVGLWIVWQTVRWLNRRPDRKALAWGTTFLVGGVLYVLSVGPAYWWLQPGDSDVIPGFYAPLSEAAWRGPPWCLKGLAWYTGLFHQNPDHRWGCAPLWRNGPRAFHWVSIIPIQVTSPGENTGGAGNQSEQLDGP